MSIKTKICAKCGQLFSRIKISAKHWQVRTYCSPKCAQSSRGRPISAYFVADASTECWNWIGRVSRTGYGVYRGHYAHRASFENFNGEIPSGRWILHRCDNRKCVNPYHLFVGDVQANVDDMFAKGRANKAVGENVGGAALSTGDIPSIRRDKRTLAEIADDYGVHPETIGAIKRGRSWKHVISASGDDEIAEGILQANRVSR